MRSLDALAWTSGAPVLIQSSVEGGRVSRSVEQVLLCGVTLLAFAGFPNVARREGTAEQDSLSVRAVRFYRAEQGQTRVKAFVQIPYQILGEPDRGDSLSYRVAVDVSDSTGLSLYQTSWRNHPSAEARKAGGMAVEMVDFAVAPGDYRLKVTVEDSLTGHKTASQVDVRGFSSPPAASDLMLAPGMRLATG
ncbi:MAG: hypothetical protein ABJD11_09165, partial [Gemmatimonadota bacterium]